MNDEARQAFGDDQEGRPVDKPWGITWATLRLLAFVLVAAASIYSSARTFSLADQNRAALDQIKAEGVERRDQICTAAESADLANVTRLRRTYDYLQALSPAEFDTPINRAVLVSLPQVESDAKTPTAPAFCDVTLKHGVPVGLPEPNPIVPTRPPELTAKLKQAQKQAAQQAAQAKRKAGR